MVKCLNDILHYTGDYMSKSNSLISNTDYPEQDSNYVGKLLFVPYRNENNHTRNFRLFISTMTHREFTGTTGPFENFTKVLRFDLAEPYVAILVDEMNYIIIGDTREIRKYTIYPGYEYSSFRGLSEVHMNMCETWDEFNNEYNSEVFFMVHSQNADYVGKPVYTEFYKDLIPYTHEDNILPREYYQNPDARINQDMINVPLRTLNQGYVIRADENGNLANFVVMLEDPNTHVRKYILGSEGYFYINTEDPLKSLQELNLWRSGL